MTDDPHRTEYAQQALAFSDLFGYKFARQSYGTRRPRRLRLTEPDGPSTAGGRLARQPMVLVPDDGEGNLVLGWVDSKARQTELRTFDALREQFAARYSVPLDLEREAYDHLVRELEDFFKIQKYDVRRAGPSKPRPAGGERGDEAVISAWILVGVLLAGILIGLAMGYVLFKS